MHYTVAAEQCIPQDTMAYDELPCITEYARAALRIVSATVSGCFTCEIIMISSQRIRVHAVLMLFFEQAH